MAVSSAICSAVSASITCWRTVATCPGAASRSVRQPSAVSRADWQGSSCTGQPFTWSPPAAHNYQFLIVDPNAPDCTDGDDPHGGCVLTNAIPFTADPVNGTDYTDTIG
jgi:hypothetical protein